MSKDWLVKAENVSKKFCKRLRHIMWYGVRDLSKEIFAANHDNSLMEVQLRTGEFWALRNISFELNPGECIGVIGANGAGKTTLLKLIDGIMRPDNGTIRIRGRVGSLIELGAGFHPMLTGRENLYVNASILGMSKTEITQKFDSIVDFAGIEDFLEAPLKTYSSGMTLRLGFSIAIHTEPEILLIDEVLAVGDSSFQRKCQQRIDEMLTRGAGLIFVSHNMSVIQHLSSHVLFLSKGESTLGSFQDVYPQYLEQSLALPAESRERVVRAASTAPEVERQTGEIEISDIRFTANDDQSSDHTYRAGHQLKLEVNFQSHTRVKEPVISVGFYREDGVLCFVERSSDKAFKRELQQGSNQFRVTFHSVSLRPGVYAAEIVINDSMTVIPLGRKRSHWIRIVDTDYVGSVRIHAPVYREPCEWEWV